MSMTWTETLQATTVRENEEWGALLPYLDLYELENWALLKLLDSCYPAPRSENGIKACRLLLNETRARLEAGSLDQEEIDRWGAPFARIVREGVVADTP